MSLESEYQSGLIKRIKSLLPGCVVLKNDSSYMAGIPDLTIFYKDRWATLEVKRSEREKKQPNQDYFVDMMDDMSFSRFIYPENEGTVLRDLQRSFESGGSSRLS